MHKNHLKIDLNLVKNLIKTNFPQWKKLSITTLSDFGTDNILFRLGDDMIIRLPRTYVSAEHLFNEAEISKKLEVLNLGFKTPRILEQVERSALFPCNFHIVKWIDGRDLFHSTSVNLNNLAVDLASFITKLHLQDTTGLPAVKRGKPFSLQDKDVMKALKQLEGEINVSKYGQLWDDLKTVPEWDKDAVFIHGDLLPTNLIMYANKLSAIIDWGWSGSGDPAIDLLPAWAIFDGDSRAIFRDNLNVDDNTWLRGKGWALSIALQILPYYKNTNFTLANIAQKILSQIL